MRLGPGAGKLALARGSNGVTVVCSGCRAGFAADINTLHTETQRGGRGVYTLVVRGKLLAADRPPSEPIRENTALK
jgi:hypothetical protein